MTKVAEEHSIKKTLGKRKIEIKRIEKKTNLQVTFSKRRAGLFKKASELGIVTGSQIAILVQSPSDKLFKFGSPEFDSVYHRFDAGLHNFPLHQSTSDTSSRIEYEEALRRLEAEKKRATELDGMNTSCWWDSAYEGMDLFELHDFANALESLGSRVLNRADDIAKLNLNATCNPAAEPKPSDSNWCESEDVLDLLEFFEF